MDFTGERLLPEVSDPDLRNEHLARYCFAEPLAQGKRVLDAGCGVGYGAGRLAGLAATVYALDNSSEALRQGKCSYAGVEFVQGDCTRLPFQGASLDLVLAFEVIEHLHSWPRLLREAARTLTPSGMFVVSTPNRTYYNCSRDEPNPFHVYEFDDAEFRAALVETFSYCVVFLQNHAPAIAITHGNSKRARTYLEAAENDPTTAHFFVAVCSRSPLDLPADLVYIPHSGNILRERELHVGKLRDWILTLERRHAEVETRMSRELSRLPYRMLRRLRLAPQLPKEWSQ